MPQHSVLLVDDDPKIAKLLRSYFEKEDFLVLTAHDGTAALQLYRDKKPDILVLDLMLPGVNGLDVCRHIRKDSDTPILMLTARDEETDRLIGLDQALERLSALDPQLARLVEMRFFAGLELTEIAEVTGRSERSLKRDWRKARAVLHAALDGGVLPDE